MATNLVQAVRALDAQVRGDLAARKNEWREIAEELGYSYEFISRLGLDTYGSVPSVDRLQRIADALSKRKARAKAAA